MTNSPRAGKPMTIKQPRRNGKLIHDEPTYHLCPCCWKVTTGGYCSQRCIDAHQRLCG